MGEKKVNKKEAPYFQWEDISLWVGRTSWTINKRRKWEASTWTCMRLRVQGEYATWKHKLETLIQWMQVSDRTEGRVKPGEMLWCWIPCANNIYESQQNEGLITLRRAVFLLSMFRQSNQTKLWAFNCVLPSSYHQFQPPLSAPHSSIPTPPATSLPAFFTLANPTFWTSGEEEGAYCISIHGRHHGARRKRFNKVDASDSWYR